jgi:uncharacterized protein involved in type VI secretion and phage assembly
MAGDAAGVRRVGFFWVTRNPSDRKMVHNGFTLRHNAGPPIRPDGQAAVQILGKIEAMLTQLDGTSTHTVRLGQIRGHSHWHESSQA